MSTHFLHRSYLFDRLIAGYSLFMVLLILLIGRPLVEYWDEILFYVSMMVIVAIIIRYLDENRSGLFRFIRLLYPILLFTFFYRTTGGVMSLIFNQYFDWQLCTFEKTLFGINPTLFIDTNFLTPWLTEPFSLCYFCYYLMIPVFFFIIYFRRDYLVVKSAMSAVSLMFFLSYLLFFLYPIEGPRWYFANFYQNSVEGSLFRPLVEMIIDKGAVHGGCMPSSHFGVAFVLLMYTFRYYRGWVAWATIALVVGIGIGAVWGRFHYVSDIIVGGILGLIATLIIWKYARVEQDKPRLLPKRKTYYAS
ncbi:MAG: phosphatase PAP2 family protein [candidate division Zixibacteria bacterium]|nr:phosphatase PAP2 family protein [candidate division Zixibacteria bacterium]